MTINERRVAIIGGGIIGLSTALEVQQLCPKVKVRIFSAEFTPNTTADGAAGIFGLYLLGDTNSDTQIKWAQKTHDQFETWWKSKLGGKMGISLVSCRRMSHEPVPPIWENVVYGNREMSSEEVKEMGRLTGKHESGLEMVTYTAEPVKFLRYMMQEFVENGGELIKMKVDNIHDLLDQHDVVVNCSGVWAGQLANDKTIQPLRGQVMRVKAPWIRTVILDDRDDGNYVIANQDSVVVGGTHQAGDWNTNPYEDDKTFIRKGGECLDGSLPRGEELRHWVGLRPGRSSVRLERVGRIVHHYGHGGSGITTFKGSGEDAAVLVKEALDDLPQPQLVLSKL